MPVRSLVFGTGEYYHVFNRGVARQPIYASVRDYQRFLLCLEYYRFTGLPFKLSRFLQIEREKREEVMQNLILHDDQIVEINAFCLMPNHFHLLLKQLKDNGITTFIKHLTNSYTRYYNTKTDRVGPMFQGIFKAVQIETNEQLLHVSRYIHLNPLVSYIVNEENFLSYPWSSLPEYQATGNGLITPQSILSQFSSRESYVQFILDQADYGKELDKIKHLTID